jgi:hypothetical protein
MSPRSIFKVQTFEGRSEDTLRPKLPLTPRSEDAPHSEPRKEPGALTPVLPRQDTYSGSRPYIGTYIIKPSRGISDAIMRAVLPHARSAALRIYQELLEDVLVKQMGFFSESHAIIAGFLHGHRVVLARCATYDDGYSVCSSDEQSAQEFLVLLRAFDMQVQPVKQE